MKSNVVSVMKKEFSRFFGDRRMVTLLFLPGVLIYVVYSFMGTALKDMLSPDADYTPIAYTVNMPANIGEMAQSAGIEIEYIGHDEVDGVLERIAQKQAALCAVFPAGFEAQAAAYNAQGASAPAPNVELYFNSVDTNSADAYRRLSAVLDAYESSLANKFDVNRDIENADRATEEDASAQFISSMLPMLLMIFLYSGCMGVAPESIAGEKERGTIATLLVTPLKRSELAMGKILSLGALAFLSGLVSAVGTIMALPKLMSGADEMISASIYGVNDYICLALVILSTILLLITVISIISAFSKTVKEASTAVMPLMIIVMLIGVSGMFGSGAKTDAIYYIVPLYNSAQSMSGVFSLDYSGLNIALTAVSNLVYACAGGFALTKMFNSERVMFS